MTAKVPLKVHLRLRFQNPGKPRTAGLCGREVPNYGHLSLSCAKIERPSPLEKPSCKVRLFAQDRSREYRQKVTGTTLFQTVFQFLSQAALVCFHGRKWVHARLSEKDRTQGHTRRNTGRFGWGWYHYPRSVSHGSETLRGRVSERHTLPLLGLDRVCSQRTQRAFGTAMRSCASLLRRRRGPAGLRDLFTFVEIAACTPYSRYFFRFSRRSSLCCSCANLISARSFSARSCSRVFGFVIALDLLF